MARFAEVTIKVEDLPRVKASIAAMADEIERLRLLVASHEKHPDVTEPHLWITPGRRGGRVCIGGQNITAEAVAERVWAEGDVECAMAEWGLSRDVVLMACWWWALYCDREGIFTSEAAVDRFAAWCDWAYAYVLTPGEAPDPPEENE